MRIILLGLLFLLMATVSQAMMLTKIEIPALKKSQRIILSFSNFPHYKHFMLNNPERFVIDMSDVDAKSDVSRISLQDTAIKAIRLAKNPNQPLRLVFELQQPFSPSIKMIKTNRKQERQLIIDFTASKVTNATPVVNVINEEKSQETKLYKAVKTVSSRSQARKLLIVIDPGHGGKDPGAIGAHGTREKNVVLAIAKELARLINQTPGMQAVLTRNGDYYIGLRERLRLARKGSADLFMSIHADAYKKRESHGASVFILSKRGASSEAARWLAERENYSEVGEANLKDKSYWVRSLLIDLSQTATIVASLDLGNSILLNLGQFAALHAHKVEQARFVVLKSPDIPSLLIETGFISNTREEMRLNSPRYRHQLALAILQGVKRYFHEHASEDAPGNAFGNA